MMARAARVGKGFETVLARLQREVCDQRMRGDRNWLDDKGSLDPIVMNSNASEASGAMELMADGRMVLFDAECVLCSANAHFILRHDKRQVFYLASMQGDVGKRLFRAHGMDPNDPATILVIDGPKVRRDSDAVISIYESLGFPWRIASILRVIPNFLRDPLYRLIARNRYRIFGKRQSCWVPPEHLRSRVL